MSDGVVDAIGGSFVAWFSDDIFPYIAGSFDIAILLISIVLNVFMIVLFKKRELLHEPPNRLIFQLIVVDILSWFFILIPGAVAAMRKQYDFSEYFCKVQGVVVNWLYLLTFQLLFIMCLERTMKIKYKEKHEKLFGNMKKVNIISVVIWIFCLSLSIIPVTGWGKIEYDFYHAGCVVWYNENIPHLIIVFMFGIGAIFFCGLVCFPIIISVRKTKLEKQRQENARRDEEVRKMMEMDSKNANATNSGGTTDKPTTKAGWTSDKAAGSKRKLGARTPRRRREKTLFEDDQSDPDFHLAVTYFILWCILFMFWLPYFIVSFYHAGNGEVWRGYYSIATMVALCSFCIKPVVYLSHNRHYQKKTEETLPKSVVERASAVRMSISDAVDKLDKLVFKSPRQQKPSIQTTVQAHTLAMKWMKSIKSVDAKKTDENVAMNPIPENEFPKPKVDESTPPSETGGTNTSQVTGAEVLKEPAVTSDANVPESRPPSYNDDRDGLETMDLGQF